MVSKIAVIALVAIVACPILLGYAMNLNETVVIDYKSDNDQMNVSQLLQTGTDWNIADGDPYVMNSKPLAHFTVNDSIPSFPIYNKVTSVKTSMPFYYHHIAAWSGGSDNGSITTFQEYQIWMDYDPGVKNVSLTVKYNNGGSTLSFSNVIYVRYSADTEKINVYCSYNYNNPNTDSLNIYNVPNISELIFNISGGTLAIDYSYVPKSITSASFADISEGFFFRKESNRPSGNGNHGWEIGLPENTISALLSINLDSITDSNYTVDLEQVGNAVLKLVKTTTSGVVSWKLQNIYSGIVISSQDLYYNPDISDNTYQVLLTDTSDTNSGYPGHAQFRYIGHWQKAIGEANYYQTYDIDYTQAGWQGNTLDGISIRANDNATSRTPTIRIDAAKFRAYEYPVIEGTLTPADFKTNPATTISKIEQYGLQIVFGGNTYNVSNGNITIGSHQIPVKNMVLDSIPNPDTLQYDNRINGTIISTTASPSTIQFVGKWSANIAIASMEQTTYTTTEWTPGQFAWNGIDQNFLMAGLFTIFGVFVGLGIYAKARRLSIWPLLIVCGGAAALFLFML